MPKAFILTCLLIAFLLGKMQEERSKSKGRGWFDMKAPEMTEEKKREIMVLQMRRSLDPKRFYKAPDIRGVPKFFQV